VEQNETDSYSPELFLFVGVPDEPAPSTVEAEGPRTPTFVPEKMGNQDLMNELNFFTSIIENVDRMRFILTQTFLAFARTLILLLLRRSTFP
jgi:hypothetical protein